MTPPRIVLEPRFLEGSAGPVFALHFRPSGEDCGQAALFLPAFGEEMNRARPMAARLGRRLAARGCGAMILDPFGTGDSAGDTADARWAVWREDTDGALGWLAEQGYARCHLVGLRSGANLALAAAMTATRPVDRVVLWQPILKGQLLLNQILRVRVAAGLGAGEGYAKETTRGLLAQLQSGETLEVAGYALSPALAEELGALDLVAQASACPVPIHWLDVTNAPQDPPPPTIEAALEALAEAKTQLSFVRVPGASFWTIEEPVLVEPLIGQTLTALGLAVP